ncbi:MAG TPA: FliM/FliN family flagellar motor C-terminal domain-containing protein [Edaphobacter sp.]|nr:FliM/FliN family flagellar motor C-terminal domain-containing protein [Edaphobacter sp.]
MPENDLVKVEERMVAESVPSAGAQEDPPELPWMMRIEEHSSWPLLSQMTVLTSAAIPISGFKIRDLVQLQPGQVVESAWAHTEDIPLKAARVQVAWSEFEVVDQNLMVRLTRLA